MPLGTVDYLDLDEGAIRHQDTYLARKGEEALTFEQGPEGYELILRQRKPARQVRLRRYFYSRFSARTYLHGPAASTSGEATVEPDPHFECASWDRGKKEERHRAPE